MSQDFFVLVVTLVLAHAQPVSIEARFDTRDACEAARVLVLQEADLFKGGFKKPGDAPVTTAACSLRPS